MRTIIIPTLNEEENIGRLIKSIFHHLGTKGAEIIVVDDNSSDQTQRIVRYLAKHSNNLHLIVRKGERGLGSAVRHGASRAKDGPAVVIDADISHHPRFLPGIFNALEKGYDVVVGSRYVEGGEIVGWPGSRIAMSKIANFLARLLFRIRVKDIMSGFVGVRSTRLLSTGFKYANYKFMLEMIVTDRSLNVFEVPIVFQDRTRGASKLDGLTIARFLLLIIRLLFTRTQSKTSIRNLEGSLSARG
ncbi:MAG: polyprenol monophosphomannose synthase [Candidatus Thorarchaeota archaeon]|jgi:dolichol-phosphate mannosyltransferase